MVDMTMISGAVSALKAAGDAAKIMIASHDISVMREKAIELQTQILAAQQSALAAQSDQFTLLDRVRELEKQITELEAWDAEKQRYELKEIWSGATAYSLKEDTGGTEPPHWICAACYQSGKRQILQPTKILDRLRNWTCPACKSSIPVRYDISPAIPAGQF
jgi:hypothetical protein